MEIAVAGDWNANAELNYSNSNFDSWDYRSIWWSARWRFHSLQAMFVILGAPYVMSDQRKQNVSSYNVNGIDFALDWGKPLGEGILSTWVNGT